MRDTVICGDVLDKLPEIPTGSVNCCVTSPPYWGLRDYGVEGQLGLEKTPEEYVAKMVAVFREVWRVLRDDGTLWLNMGDTYYMRSVRGGDKPGMNNFNGLLESNKGAFTRPKVDGLKPKDMCGMPWRLAFALQADGWYLRQDIIWHKPNPMPESVRDRCTKAHEYIFLLTKKPRYYYDAEAIKEESHTPPHAPGCKARPITGPTVRQKADGTSASQWAEDSQSRIWGSGSRNKRSVWTVTTKPYSEAHFATFPPDLILPCILAGCPQQVCKKCGEPRRRIVEKPVAPKEAHTKTRQDDGFKVNKGFHKDGEAVGSGQKYQNWLNEHPTKTTGWTDCGCNAGFDGGVVLDPFMGSGTVGLVAYQNNRHYLGIELNPEYCKLGRIEKEQDKYALFENNP